MADKKKRGRNSLDAGVWKICTKNRAIKGKTKEILGRQHAKRDNQHDDCHNRRK